MYACFPVADFLNSLADLSGVGKLNRVARVCAPHCGCWLITPSAKIIFRGAAQLLHSHSLAQLRTLQTRFDAESSLVCNVFVWWWQRGCGMVTTPINQGVLILNYLLKHCDKNFLDTCSCGGGLGWCSLFWVAMAVMSTATHILLRTRVMTPHNTTCIEYNARLHWAYDLSRLTSI